MASDIDPVEFGELKANVARLLESDRVKTELLETMAASLHSMQLQMAEAKGGWKVLMMIAGASATVGSGLTWVLAHLPSLPIGKGPP